MSKTTATNPLIKCVECLHAKQYREVEAKTGRFALKVRCAKGHWQHGRNDGACDLHRVMARRTRQCSDYVSTSEDEFDRTQFLADLGQSLPLERVVYEPSGQAVDITEAFR